VTPAIVSFDTIADVAAWRPPFALTSAVLVLTAEISRLLGRLDGMQRPLPEPKLRREIQVRTVVATLAIEGELITEDRVTALLDGKRVAGRANEIVAAKNAIAAYRHAASLRPGSTTDFRRAHQLMMKSLIPDAGSYRRGAVGIMQGSRVSHIAPPAKRVATLVADLLGFVARDRQTHALVKSAVAHYEIEFIHAFSDGNGRMGRLWQHVILLGHDPAFAHVLPETVVRARQADYYAALAASDTAGDATVFVEYSLETVRDALRDFMSELRPRRATAADRVGIARAHFGRREFSRGEYLALQAAVGPATASRDLASGVRDGILVRTGDKATTRYRFTARRR
jgi:Fic family protein